jgi:peptide-methionine (R)-S-oxide reductase
MLRSRARARARAGTGAPPPVQKPDRQWRAELTPLQYKVLRQRRTEPAFAGEFVEHDADGVYRCAGCRGELFRSAAKFASRAGWPSFSEPAGSQAVELRAGRGVFPHRTEVACRRCGSHLGHVFGDGPTAARDRYCINSCALAFEAAGGAAPGAAV